jgi:hypothetical protein
MNLRPLFLTSPLLMATLGCQATDADLARQALRTQAEQNQAMAQAQREVAAGARELTAADADARRQSIKLHALIQTERTRLSEGWSELHAQRDREALSQRTDSFLSALVQGGGAAAAALFALAIVRSVLVSQAGEDGSELAALLLAEMSAPGDLYEAAPHATPALPSAATRLAFQHLEKQ